MSNLNAQAAEPATYGGDVIAEHLISTYDLQPYFLDDGTIGIHFMGLSTSIESDRQTLLSETQERIEALRMGLSGGALDPAGMPQLRELRCTLMKCVYALDAAIKEMKEMQDGQ